MQVKWRLQFKQALAMLHDLSGSAAESISTLRNPQKRRVWREVVRVRRPSWTELRQRAGITFWVSTLGFVLFTAFIWSYDPIDSVYNKALLNLVYTVVPLSTILEQEDARASHRGLAPFFVPVVALVSWVIEPLLWPPGQRPPGRGCPGRCGGVRRCSVGATPLFSPERPPKTRTNFR